MSNKTCKNRNEIRNEKRNRNRTAELHKAQGTSPRNGLIALLIFGTLALMFAFIWGYKYYQLSPSIEKYMESAGGDAVYGSMQIDDETVMSMKADGNKLKIVSNITTDGAAAAKEKNTGKDAKDNMKYLASYYLYSMKSNCRGLTSSVTYTIKVNGEKVNSVSMSFRKAKKYLKENGVIS